jgi:hypothetical protein
MLNVNLPAELEALVKAELDPGERVRWTGQPNPGLLSRRGVSRALFGIPFTAFSVFWIAAASRFRMPDFSQGGFSFFPLFGIPFFLVGLFLLTSPLWMRQSARRTAYILTERRAITFVAGFGRAITGRSYELHRLLDIERVQNPDGSGDLIFERTSHTDRDGKTTSTEQGFLAVSDVKKVETLVRQLSESAARRASLEPKGE